MEEKRGESRKPAADFLFEVSWEVCNKVGGINTVIKSKIPQTKEFYKDRYCLIGPYFHDRVKGEFEEEVVPEEHHQVAEDLKRMGLVIHYGRWLTEGKPLTILIDFQPFFARTAEIKGKIWEIYKVDSLQSGFEFDEPVVWSWAAGIVMEKLSMMMPDKKVVALVHEWLSGAAVLYLKSQKAKIGTVFVSHATVIGRCLATAGVDIYGHDEEGKCKLKNIDLETEAYQRGVHSKHQIEKTAAHTADVFCTVSEITGMEAECTLKKKPDILVPNGLNLDNFPTFEDASIRHHLFRDKIYHFMLYYFLPYQNMDFDNTLIYFVASRYEFQNKGIDITIKALAKLNATLKNKKSEKNIVVFFWVPSGIRGIKTEITENKMLFKDIEDHLKDSSEHVMWHLLNTIVADRPITRDAIFDKEFLSEIKKKVLRFKSDTTSPPVCTHDLTDPNDQIIRAFRESGLSNSEEDKVKVIYYPIYLTGADNLLDLTYYEAMLGSHFGIFPSYYEPWGYTPLESGALGVASVTSNLAGFGRYLKSQPSYKSEGIFILERMGMKHDDTVEALHRILYYYTLLPKKKRIDSKIEARSLAKLADWALLINNYIDAENLAFRRAFGG